MSDLQASRPQAGIRGLFAGAAKLALGLFLASVALAATLGATYWAKRLYDEREAAPYAVPRMWSDDLSAWKTAACSCSSPCRAAPPG